MARFSDPDRRVPTIYRTAEGERVMRVLYREAREALGVETEDFTLSTRFGPTHVLVTGPREAPPVLIFQGGNFLNPLNLAWFQSLLSRYRVYAPDTVGQPGLSHQGRVSARDTSLGWWVLDVLNGMGLDRGAIIGASYGAGIVLRLATIAPDRIERAALVVPAAVVQPPLGPLLRRLVLPMLRYRLRPTRQNLRAAVQPLFTEMRIDDLWLRTLGAVFDHLKVETAMPRPAAPEELRGFHAPVLVVAAEGDMMFPGAAVLEQARRLLPNLWGAELLSGSAHVPSDGGLAHLNTRLLAFLAEEPTQRGSRSVP